MGQKITRHIEQPKLLIEGSFGKTELEQFKTQKIWQVHDIFDRQAADLFEITNPSLVGQPGYGDQLADYLHELHGQDPELAGNWIYFPWNGNLIHCLGAIDQDRLRTNRNQNLITADEQARLAKARVAIAGLSVGGGIAVSLAYSGIAGTMYLADFDVLETPNLNRVRARLADVGTHKAEIVAHQIWDVAPYNQLTLFTDGVNDDTIENFMGGDETVQVIFDEIDDFKTKLRLRYEAKKRKTALVMLTGLGDSILIDVERYDHDPELPIFNGLIGNLEADIMTGEITKDDERRYAAQIVDLKNVPTRAIESLIEMGRSLVGRPQLGSTVAIEGGIAAFIVRAVVLGRPLVSGRYRLDLNDIVGLESESLDSEHRTAALRSLLTRS